MLEMSSLGSRAHINSAPVRIRLLGCDTLQQEGHCRRGECRKADRDSDKVVESGLKSPHYCTGTLGTLRYSARNMSVRSAALD